LNSGKHRQNW